MDSCVIFLFLTSFYVSTAYVTESNNNVVRCEFADRRFGYTNELLSTCEIFTKRIDSSNYTIFDDKNNNQTQGITLNYNKNSRYLPVHISYVFPNLVEISASFCKIQKVTKKNFHGLTKVKAINLSKNELEVIDDDTFSDLVSLEWLGLDTNLIRVIDGNSIKKLPVLQHLFLLQNRCIDQDFHGRFEIVEIHFECDRANSKYAESVNELERLKHELAVCEAERDDFRNMLVDVYRHKF